MISFDDVRIIEGIILYNLTMPNILSAMCGK